MKSDGVSRARASAVLPPRQVRFGRLSVSGRRRVPRPAAKISAFILLSLENFCVERLLDVLLAVHELHLDVEFLVDMLCHVLRAVDRTVLSAGASEANHQIRESALLVAFHRGVDKGIGVVEKLEYLAVVLKKLYHLVVEARKRLVALILAGVVDGAAVKHVAAAVARRVVGDAFLVGETHHAHRERVLLQVVSKLLQANKLFEYLAEVGILG